MNFPRVSGGSGSIFRYDCLLETFLYYSRSDVTFSRHDMTCNTSVACCRHSLLLCASSKLKRSTFLSIYTYLCIYGSKALCWTLASCSVPSSFTQLVRLFGRGTSPSAIMNNCTMHQNIPHQWVTVIIIGRIHIFPRDFGEEQRQFDCVTDS